jgi:hypothetical protein
LSPHILGLLQPAQNGRSSAFREGHYALSLFC